MSSVEAITSGPFADLALALKSGESIGNKSQIRVTYTRYGKVLTTPNCVKGLLHQAFHCSSCPTVYRLVDNVSYSILSKMKGFGHNSQCRLAYSRYTNEPLESVYGVCLGTKGQSKTAHVASHDVINLPPGNGTWCRFHYPPYASQRSCLQRPKPVWWKDWMVNVEDTQMTVKCLADGCSWSARSSTRILRNVLNQPYLGHTADCASAIAAKYKVTEDQIARWCESGPGCRSAHLTPGRSTMQRNGTSQYCLSSGVEWFTVKGNKYMFVPAEGSRDVYLA